MGLFSFIGKAYSGLVTAIAKPILLGIGKITKKKYVPMTAKEFREKPFGKVLTTAFTGTTLALGVATLPVTAPIVVKGVVAKPVIALVGAGLLVTKGGRKLIEKGVEGVFVGGKALGEAYEVAEEKGEKLGLGEALKTAGLVGAGLVLGAGIPAVIKKVKEKVPEIPPIFKEPAEIIIPEKPIGVEGEQPILPETTTITTGKRRYKRRRAKITPSVKQSVRVNIINRSSSNRTHKYLNSLLVCR